VRGAFDLDYGFVGADGMVAVLEVEAEGEVGGVLEEDFADGAVDDVVDGRGLAGDIRLPKRGEIVVTDGVNEGGHGEISKIAQVEDFGILKQTEVYDLDLDFNQEEN